MGRQARLIALLAIDSAFFFLEIIVGYAVGSLALVADSFHMLNDVISLIVALWALRLSKADEGDAEADPRFSYGWQRAEVLGALVNGVFLLALCFSIFMEAIQRFFNVQEVQSPRLVVSVGSLGLLSNIVGLFLFHDHGHSHGGHSHGHSHSHGPEPVQDEPAANGHSADQTRRPSLDTLYGHPAQTRASVVQTAAELRHGQQTNGYGAIEIHGGERATLPDAADVEAVPHGGDDDHGHDHDDHGHAHGAVSGQDGAMNMQGVFLHVMGDALGNVGVIASGLFIWLSDKWWRYYTDPAISFLLTVIIFHSALPLVKSASFILLQGVPSGVRLESVKRALLKIPGVTGVHELHIWQLSESKLVASVHLHVDCSAGQTERYHQIASQVKQVLHHWGVHSSTIQPEFIPSTDDAARQIQGQGQAGSDDCLLACNQGADAECDAQGCCPPSKAASTKGGATTPSTNAASS